jgi:Arrestin (or S-antigen), N-terminal domain
MSVRIQFDRPQIHYTNLDFITGKVVVHLVADAAISAVTVKLEGESRTRLSGPKLAYNNERSEKRRTELEWHKVSKCLPYSLRGVVMLTDLKLLYKVETLFPSPDVQQQTGNASYMLLAGQYEYPFRFKFPFNNNCQNNNMMRDLKVRSMGIAFNPDMNVKHVKKTLPPSISGFPGEAEIKYYVKATVVRPKFYQENIRSQVDIKFLPIEPPRPPQRLEETFARRKQQFAK